MSLLLTLATLLLASVAPGAKATSKRPSPISCPDEIVKKLFVKDLPPELEFYVHGTADAQGANTDTSNV